MSLKQFLVRNAPFLGRYKRYWKAYYQSITNRDTYSQHAEDVFFKTFIQRNNIDVKKYIYVDVGANHPTDISNTYLLYKMGMRGVIIEPNKELINLSERFRKEDTRFAIGVSDKNEMLQFFVSKTPVVSSFIKNRDGDEDYKSYFVPVLTLDDAMQSLPDKHIFLLSVDVEGLNIEVLRGAKSTIAQSMLLCVEYDTVEEKAIFQEIIGPSFREVAEYGCNIIYCNTGLIKDPVL